MDIKVLPKALSEATLKSPFTPIASLTRIPKDMVAEAMGFYAATVIASRSNKNTRLTREEHDAASLEKRTQLLKKQDELSQKMRAATKDSMKNIALLADVASAG